MVAGAVLYAWGDPVSDGPPFAMDASNTVADQAEQAGMHHDGIHFFPLPHPSEDSRHGLLIMNHEYTDDGLLHVGGMVPWTAEKVAKSLAAHGVSVIEVRKRHGGWEVVRPSRYGRRITGHTPCRIAGPAAGHLLLQTLDDPTGTRVLGTLNNCAHGVTPWGTYLACEENFNGYFFNTATGGVATTPLQARYGVGPGFGYRWHEHEARFDVARHPNESNRFGWVVEIDPFRPSSTPVKRTALGRFKHEGATPTLAKDGRCVFYMGDDERFEYIYKFVSRRGYRRWGPRWANADLLDEGTLFVARFAPDGSGERLPLVFGQGALTPANGFGSQAEVLVNARRAADLAGATKMDRPEWIAVHPKTGEVYCTLTNNTNRGVGTNPGTDPANPRVRNAYGHIIRWREDGHDAAATRFEWDIFVLCGDPVLHPAPDPLAGNIDGDIFGSPDGLWIDERGVLWIETDVSTSTLNAGEYVNTGNNQMLAADPGTREIRRFLTGPRGCEVTGVVTTPDGRTMFVNIQHPGEPASERNNPANPRAVSNWPDFDPNGRPRSATLVIEKLDGGVIGT
jgi:secreted PhoX family phosphatase